MRRRSNAIHSESQEEYMLLAEYSHERPGYFYDQKFREEVDRKLNRHKQQLVAAKKQEKLMELPGFDYNPEHQERKEEEAEISLPSKRGEVVLTIIANSVEQTSEVLRSLFGSMEQANQKVTQVQEERILDLFTITHSETLFKIWIIKFSSFDNALLQPYLTHTREVINLSQQMHDFQDVLASRVLTAVHGTVGRSK